MKAKHQFTPICTLKGYTIYSVRPLWKRRFRYTVGTGPVRGLKAFKDELDAVKWLLAQLENRAMYQKVLVPPVK